MYRIIPESQKSIIDSIRTLDDFSDLSNNYPGVARSDNCNNKLYYFTMPIKLEETNSPFGYQKSDSIVSALVNVYFAFDENGYIHNKLISINSFGGIYKYDNTINYYDYVGAGNSFYDYLVQNGQGLSTECNGVYPFNTYNGSSALGKRCFFEEFLVIEDEVGEVVLTIDNTVQEKHQISVSGNNRVQYKVLVSNTGNASSGNNIVKASIPKEIEVVEDSISDDGVYVSGDRTITWNIDYIDPYGEEELTYDVLVPGDKFGKYTVTSSVSSDQQNKLSISEPAVVNVVKNPHTGNITFAIELLLIFTILFVIYNLYRKITKVHD